MIKLKKSSLQDYQKLTQYIQRNTILPVLSYLKLEHVQGQHQLTKSNNNSICIANIDGTCDAEYEPLLIDDRILFSFLSECVGEQIIIQVSNSLVRISDGQTEIDFSKEDVSNFPRIPTSEGGESFVFTKDILASIAVARSFVNDSETAGDQQFIHMGGQFIAALNHHSVFVSNRFKNLPGIFLSKEQADVITASSNDLRFTMHGNHYFFESGAFQFVFTRKEGTLFNKSDVLFSRMKMPGTEFKMNKNDLTGFCNIANIVSESPVSLCSMSKVDNFARLKLLENSYNRTSNRDVPVTGNLDEFFFNARLISPQLKVIPTDNLECKTVQNNLIISGNQEYFCFAGMAKP